jgi:peptide-methionine (S)-S-oxide reductase
MSEIAVLGGGCFWCTESVFMALKGVESVEPGYCGGHVPNPTYEQVCSKATGHIEVVKVKFNPQVISYETLLQVFFHTHDPCTLDRQGNDVGPQYASAIFVQSDEQRRIAQSTIQALQPEFAQPVVTRVLPAQTFWPAEHYHYDYFRQNPNQGYCSLVIAPKIAKFRRQFGHLLAS